MKPTNFVERIKCLGVEYFIGVPDSTLKELCDYLNSDGKKSVKHYTTANEGSAVGMAVGVYLASKKPSCLYLQNSGIGNIINPLTSIAHKDVYDIPMLFVVGYRGERSIKDEPQHKFMGKITENIFDCLTVKNAVIDSSCSEEDLDKVFRDAKTALSNNEQFAIIVKKDTFVKQCDTKYSNEYSLNREQAISAVLKNIDPSDAIVSTTGKISREVYEQCNAVLGTHKQAFLTVGGMGHCSMIAFGLCNEQKNRRVYCIDGDGAALMHLGNMATIGKQKPDNLVHICLNNECHESVGGMPTGATGISYSAFAKKCGYEKIYSVLNEQDLVKTLKTVKAHRKLSFIEIKVSVDSRTDLGRPKESPIENKNEFITFIEES